jgi:Ca-activated chloride channel homolog
MAGSLDYGLAMTGGLVLTGVFSMAVALAGAGVAMDETASARPQEGPRFRSAVDLVSVAAVVRDRRGRLVTDLSRDDFEILEAGHLRPILDFRMEASAPVRIAVLVDGSGSMRLGQKAMDARQAAGHLFSAMAGVDTAAVYTFDTILAEPYGQTSLFDAIGAAARAVAAGPSGGAAARTAERTAIAVFTDGIDTGSRLSPREVAVAASGIDVPVYIVALASGVDDPRAPHNRRQAANASDLRDLAHGTGGELFVASAPAEASVAARQILGELRHQYVLAFEASDRAGWRPLEVRTRQRSLAVRARTGYGRGAPVSALGEE